MGIERDIEDLQEQLEDVSAAINQADLDDLRRKVNAIWWLLTKDEIQTGYCRMCGDALGAGWSAKAPQLCHRHMGGLYNQYGTERRRFCDQCGKMTEFAPTPKFTQYRCRECRSSVDGKTIETEIMAALLDLPAAFREMSGKDQT